MASRTRRKHHRGSRKSLPAAARKPVANSKGKAVVEPEMSGVGSNPNYGYCSVVELEEVLLKKLHSFYSEALLKLVGLGYDEDSALRAVLRSGHCYGAMDVVSNILNNAMAKMSGSGCGEDGCECEDTDEGGDRDEDEDEGFPGFSDLRELEEYSLAGMICLLLKFRANLSKFDAMWCLLMCDLHVGRACSLDITSYGGSRDLGKGGGGHVGTSGSLLCCGCGDEGYCGEGLGDEAVFSDAKASLRRDLEGLKVSSLPPLIKSMQRRNVASIAAGFQANSKSSRSHLDCCECASISESPAQNAHSEVLGDEHYVKSQTGKKTEDINEMLSKFRDMLIEDKMESLTDVDKEAMIKIILKKIKKLEGQVTERKEWAQEKALQAARKLSNDLSELRVLKTEKLETQKLQLGKQPLDEMTMKRLTEMENALRIASARVDRANAVMIHLETENAETKAEIEAAKLSESESGNTSVNILKRERKSLKKLLTFDKQKTELQEEITNGKQKILELQSQVAQITGAQNDVEVKLREELTAKEVALAQVEEERRLKEAAEALSKRKLESLRLKIEMDFQCQKDDLQRLEQEQSRLKASVQAAELQSNAIPWREFEEPISLVEGLESLLGLDEKEDSLEREGKSDRDCMMCMEGEVSVVFLPCAHQVLCGNCNEKYGKKGSALCPCCWVPIKQRIRVYGASS